MKTQATISDVTGDRDERDALPTRRIHIGRWLMILSAVVALLCLTVQFAIIQQRATRISRTNYDRIETGMSKADLVKMLGPPDRTSMQFGTVYREEGGGAYAANFSGTPSSMLRSQGYDDYQFLQWSSMQITIVVVCDTSDNVATRYTSGGRKPAWLSLAERAMSLFP